MRGGEVIILVADQHRPVQAEAEEVQHAYQSTVIAFSDISF